MNPIDDDPLLQLYGSGKDLWADEYVRGIREGWDEAAELRESPKRPPAASSDEKAK
jgi:hypothetical protein